MELEYLPVQHSEMPVRKEFEIDGTRYLVDFDYNTRGDFYTATIRNGDEDVLYSGKLTYLSNLINGPVEGLAITSRIIPLNLGDVIREWPLVQRISQSNFDEMRICLL